MKCPVALKPALLCVGLMLICGSCALDTKAPYQINANYTVGEPQFPRTLSSVLNTPLIGGNRVRTYSNGDEIFPAMLDAIAGAQKTINFETYVYEKGNIGAQFANALAQRARAGVKVCVLVDALGAATMDPKCRKQMKDAGVDLRDYHPFPLLNPFGYDQVDHRTHRKLLVVDGHVGFTGGVGIGDEWAGHAQDSAHWRDNHYRVDGPVVGQLQATFADNWMATTGIVLQGNDYFPALPAAGGQYAQVFKSSFDGGNETMQLLFLLSVAGAGKTVRMETPYFVLDKVMESYLLAARKRGVEIEVIVPGTHIDVPMVRWASRAQWGDLLKAGIGIYEYRHTMIHSKLMIVDDLWVSVGSANLDNRSFRLNAEANLNVYDAGFAAEQLRMFERDKANAKRITLEDWQHRPLPEDVENVTAVPLSSEL